MRPTIKLVAIAALALLALVLAMAIAPDHGHSMTIGGSGALNIEGSPQCSGPATAGNVLEFNSGQWCDAALPASPTIYWTTYLGTVNGLTNGTSLNTVFLPAAAHVTRIQAQQLIASAGCTTQAQICIMNPATCVTGGTLTLDTAGSHTSAALSDANTGGNTDVVKISQADSGCGTHAQAINITVSFTFP
jgi:hypothetical protein